MIRNYILQIDTATELCSVSMSFNGKTIGIIEAQEPNIHASKLTVFIDQLLKDVNITYQDLAAICVSKGPGSYTGLRIGVSTAKGLCYALDIPLLAINTLEMMYEGATKYDLGQNTLYAPMLDARRMEVYLEVYNASGKLIVPTEARIIEAHSFDDFDADRIVLFGSGASKLSTVLANNPKVHIDSQFVHSSSYMSKIAYQKLTDGVVEDLIYFEPFYLKEFIAILPKKLI